MIEAKKLSKAFGEHQVLKELSIAFEDGSRTCLMGASGCGTTTFLSLLIGLQKPDSGEIVLPENCRFGVVFQENRLLQQSSAIANLKLVCGRKFPEETLHEALEQVGLERESHFLPAAELSGGMARRVAIVRAMLAPSDVILMDEPLKGLDEENRSKTIAFIKAHLDGKTLIVVTHDSRDPGDLDAQIIDFAAL